MNIPNMADDFTLIIVESPAKCKKIESYLGPKYKCIASYGHLRELKDMEAIKIEQNFTPIFTEMPDKTTQINKIRTLIKKADEVLLASDADREGEAIAWHICDMFKLPIEKTKRIIFHEITEPAIKKAVLNPQRLNMPLVHAQIARQVLDLLVGYTLSPVLWKHITKHSKNGLSAGRCQTPALRLIYENQQEINKAVPESVYTVTGYFTSKNIPFILNSTPKNEAEMKAFLEKEKNYNHEFTCGETRLITKKPPKPFTTSTLQQAASNEMHISPKETMQICQKLYEAGYITYMRTDSTKYSDEFLKQMQAFISKEYGADYFSIEKQKESEDPHEAIRPTNIHCKELGTNIHCKELDQTEFSGREMRMYKLIHNNTMESCMPSATYSCLTASISSSIADNKYIYACEQLIFPGWKIIEKDDKENNFAYLQNLKNKSVLLYKKITAKVSLKNMKQHYTEARLVHLLEEYGIGRPSTFSSLIEKIQERGYVLKTNVEGKEVECVDFELVQTELTHLKNKREFGGEKNKLIIQPTGIIVLEFLLDKFSNFFDYAYTKQMEDTLDLIAKGEKVWYELCKEGFNEINEILKNTRLMENETTYDKNFKITLDKQHDYIIGKYGPVIKCTKNKKITFKAVKPDIDLDKLKKGEYTLAELIVENKLTGRALGKYKDNEVILKNGKFGLYIEWGECKQSIKQITKELDEVTLEDVLELLHASVAAPPSAGEAALSAGEAAAAANEVAPSEAEAILDLIANPVVRKITDDLSIRTGKYGDYVFYKKKTMKNPKFFKLNGFDEYKTCNLSLLKKWIIETYRLKI